MAVAVTLDFPAATAQQYDAVIAKMGFTPGGPGGPGGLFHWVTETGDGLHITDVWQTREAFEKFAEEKIGPITTEVGLGEPRITFHDVHNFLTAG